jgi:hypothetical protein
MKTITITMTDEDHATFERLAEDVRSTVEKLATAFVWAEAIRIRASEAVKRGDEPCERRKS